MKVKLQSSITNKMTVNVCQLYLITPPQIKDVNLFCLNLEAALSAAPVSCLQIRLKKENNECEDDVIILSLFNKIKPICDKYGTLIIINDNPYVAKKARADGVHLGQKDADYSHARELLGHEAIIGITCHNSKELAFNAVSSGADYVAFGAFYSSETKYIKHKANMEILEWWQEAMEIPCVAIGGIDISNVENIIKAGADFIAMSNAIWSNSEDIASVVSQLSQLCQQHIH
jgi:thiamine-phosphate pyrophosphorylase